MEPLYFLREYPRLIGESSFWIFFSALKISNEFGLSLYGSRKMLSTLREMGLIRRSGNQYALTSDGQNFAYTLAQIKEGMITK